MYKERASYLPLCFSNHSLERNLFLKQFVLCLQSVIQEPTIKNIKLYSLGYYKFIIYFILYT